MEIIKSMRTASWIVTAILGILFIIRWANLLQVQTRYGSPGTSIPVVLGLLLGLAIIPAIFWIITIVIERKQKK
jgi:hypothetical protein